MTSQGKDMFGGVSDRPLSRKCPALRTLPIYSASMDRLENTFQVQIDSIPALVEHAVIRLFGDAGSATDSSFDTKMISVIQTVVNRALAKASEVPTFIPRRKMWYKNVCQRLRALTQF